MIEFPVDRVAALIGHRPIEWVESAGGYTQAGRWKITTDDGSHAFVKAALGPHAAAIRREASVLAELSGSFHPQLLAFSDESDLSMLVTEDLWDALWPPPYPKDPRPLFAALEELADHDVPEDLRRLRRPACSTWLDNASNKASLTDLGVYSDEWLNDSVDVLVEAEAHFDPTGDSLVHNDLWSGNIAFTGDRCVFIDWAEAHRGSKWVDRGFATLSLRSEGGFRQTGSFPGDVSFAAWWSGSLAQRLIRGVEPWLDPEITAGLHQDLVAALRWVAELLDIPPPGNVDCAATA